MTKPRNRTNRNNNYCNCKFFVLSCPSTFPSFSPREIKKMNSIAKTHVDLPSHRANKNGILQPIWRIIPLPIGEISVVSHVHMGENIQPVQPIKARRLWELRISSSRCFTCAPQLRSAALCRSWLSSSSAEKAEERRCSSRPWRCLGDSSGRHVFHR